MNSYIVILIALSIGQFNCLNINGKDYKLDTVSENGVSKQIVYKQIAEKTVWVAKSKYNKTYLNIGWDTFDVETNPELDDSEQAFVAGYLEGSETSSAIFDHYTNIVKPACVNDSDTCQRLNDYLDTNTQWIKEMVTKHADRDVYWQQVNLFYEQMAGLAHGYGSVAPDDEKLSSRDIMWMNFILDFEDLRSAFKNESNTLKGNTHCSAIIKIVHGQSDIIVAHNTWIGYETMRRIVKRYTLPYKQVASTSVSFPGYPGVLVSNDDFFIVSSGLVVQETTNSNNNASLWALVQPTGQVFEIVRVAVANRLATGGRSWAKIFSSYNSGTFNNQWMIVDMKKFSPGSVQPELLWVAEQVPGYVHSEDQTSTLTLQGYWASYNRPFYPDIFNIMGNQQLVEKYGDFFTHDKTPRALIFQRDQHKAVDIHSMMQLMRSNDFQHDPLSRCNCSPPYSSENTIASRGDLNSPNGVYPFPTLAHRPYGATDAKVTNYQLSKSLSFLAVSGPTTGTKGDLPPFQWSKSDSRHQLSHRGHPDLFNFDPVLFSWPVNEQSN